MLRPAVVLWWGIGLTLLGVVLGIALPALAYGSAPTVNGIDQGLLILMQAVLQLLTGAAPLVGAALIAAGVVMAYLKRLVERAPEHAFRLRADPADPTERP